MAEILNFFNPVEIKDFSDTSFLSNEASFGHALIVNSAINPIPHSSKFEMAIIGVNQYLEPHKSTKTNTPQVIREELYRLKRISSGLRIADLGNLRTGKNISETLFALQEACALLFHQKINVIIIGGSQMLTTGNFRALKEFENNINLVSVDAKIDLASSTESVKECHYLNTIIENEAAHVFNVACVGYQSYFVDPKHIKFLDENYFEHYRLGKVRDSFANIEPVFREAHLVSFDISSVRMSEAPAQSDGSPNGFYADEACRLARYAGISNRVQSFGIYEIDAQLDRNRQTTKLAAQIIWYYIEGYKNRKYDFPDTLKENFTKYEVQIDEIDFPIVFLKNNQSNRWWIEVNGINGVNESHETVIVSCTESDYSTACHNEIPDRWWINFKKMK